MRQFLLLSLLLLASCVGTNQLSHVLSQPVDTTVQQQVQVARLLAGGKGKIKFNGPVTIQLGGTGNSANTTEAKGKPTVAAGPGAVATATTSGISWKVLAVVVGLALALGAAGYYFLAPKVRL